nr:hypothetical protein B0A51_15925 [Rachicladosporium sp. CCFEE 5018]
MTIAITAQGDGLAANSRCYLLELPPELRPEIYDYLHLRRPLDGTSWHVWDMRNESYDAMFATLREDWLHSESIVFELGYENLTANSLDAHAMLVHAAMHADDLKIWVNLRGAWKDSPKQAARKLLEITEHIARMPALPRLQIVLEGWKRDRGKQSENSIRSVYECMSAMNSDALDFLPSHKEWACYHESSAAFDAL